MKRHPALQPLSDDHHGALVLARRISRAAASCREPAVLAEAWADAQRRFERELGPHFRAEEERLFPPLASRGEGELVARARADHERLRALVRAEADPAVATEFGELLHRHVRFEERELFPRAEAVLSPAELEAAGRAALLARPASPKGAQRAAGERSR